MLRIATDEVDSEEHKGQDGKRDCAPPEIMRVGNVTPALNFLEQN